MNELARVQKTDLKGNPVMNSNSPKLITSAATTTIFTGPGVFMGMVIWKDADAGTFYFTDASDQSIAGMPNATYKGMLDYPGQFPVPRLELENGLKIVTANCTGLVMTVFAAT